jgi:hypothetical protein
MLTILDIALYLFQLRESIKVFHWTTKLYGHHKCSDQFIAELDKHIDALIEILQGSRNIRVDIKKIEKIEIYPVDKDNIIAYLNNYKNWLLTTLTKSIYNTETDALAIRDAMMSNTDIFIYLLSFS